MQFQNKNGYISSWVSEGEGKKIIFLPGWAEPYSVWQRSIPKNLVGYEKIFMNLGGHFPSEFPQDKDHIQLEEFLDIHFDVFHKIAGNGKLILIGHSTGAFINWQYMNRFPNKVEKNILVGSFLEGPIGGIVSIMENLRHLNLSFLADFVLGLYQDSKTTFYESALSINPERKQEFFNRDDVKEFFPVFFEDYKKLESKSLRIVVEILESIRLSNMNLRKGLPLHFIHGEKDPVVSISRIKQFCETYKTAKLISLADIGHSPHWENPTLFWNCVKEILESKE